MIIYGPVLDTPLGPLLDLSFITCALIVGHKLLFLNRAGPMLQDRLIWQLLFFILAIFLATLLNLVLLDMEHISSATRGLMRPLRVSIMLLAVAIFAKNMIEQTPLDKLWQPFALLYAAIVIHSILMVSQFIFPILRDVVYEFTYAKYVLQNYQGTRMAGLTGGGGAQLSIIQSMGLLLAVFLFFEAKGFRGRAIVIVSAVVIVVSILLTGRSGLVTLLLFCPPMIFYFLNQRNYRKRFYASFAVIAIASVLVVIGAQTMLDSVDDNPYMTWIFNRTFETFINYQESGKVNDETINALLEMIILPESAAHLLIGRITYLDTNTQYGINTDIGYLQVLWGYGFLGSALHYLFYLLAIASVIKLRYVSGAFKSVPLAMLLLVLFFHLKETMVFSKYSFQISMMTVFFVYYINKKKIQHKKLEEWRC